MASLTYKFDTRGLDAKIRRHVMASGGSAEQDVTRRAVRVRDRAKTLARTRRPHSSGKVAGSYRYNTTAQETRILGRVGSDLEAARWLEEGTGEFGPRGRPIVPTHGKFLRFVSRTSGKVVFARSVSGQKPAHVLRDAADAARS